MRNSAVISVYDKTGLHDFARELQSLGVEILSTGGTANFLKGKGVQITSIDQYTGQEEILGGRVKTLHPKIHAGILARRENQEDLAQLKKQDVALIDFVVVNLYPFADKLAEFESKGYLEPDTHGHDELVEFIDIGGPAMIRAAAKNFKDVVVICDPADYEVVLSELRQNSSQNLFVSKETRIKLASKVFTVMSAYDASIARYLSLSEQVLDSDNNPIVLAPIEAFVLERTQELRYGENPHRQAGLYRPVKTGVKQQLLGKPRPWTLLQGKELSYNNLLDLHAALDLFLDLRLLFKDKQSAVIIKHSNPCGAALKSTSLEAFVAAKKCDPVSAFGGIIVVSGLLDAELAKEITSDFVEVVAASDITSEAESIFARKKNIRLIKSDFEVMIKLRRTEALSLRVAFGDYLSQTSDVKLEPVTLSQVVTNNKPQSEMLEQLNFAWALCKHVKSNAIVLVKDSLAIGVGAGQMSRLDSAKIAVQRALNFSFDVRGAVAASDAFLPFPDTLEILSSAGVSALVQPGGSIKDAEVIQAADKLGVMMLMTGERHFRH